MVAVRRSSNINRRVINPCMGVGQTLHNLATRLQQYSIRIRHGNIWPPGYLEASPWALAAGGATQEEIIA